MCDLKILTTARLNDHSRGSFGLGEKIIWPLNSIHEKLLTVNPLLSPPGGLFISSPFEGGGGGLIEKGAYLRGGLI